MDWPTEIASKINELRDVTGLDVDNVLSAALRANGWSVARAIDDYLRGDREEVRLPVLHAPSTARPPAYPHLSSQFVAKYSAKYWGAVAIDEGQLSTRLGSCAID